MGIEYFYTLVSLILAISVASERLVEIMKGAFGFLSQKYDDPKKEGRRQAAVQSLAIICGILTAFLAQNAIPAQVLGVTGAARFIVLGVLSGGGSSFWNSILTYLLKAKDIKGAKADAIRNFSAATSSMVFQTCVKQEVEPGSSPTVPVVRSEISVRI